MNSFYGGKEGRSFAIIERFNNTTEMINAFSRGAGYTDVNYGEYVIIDTVLNDDNLDSPDNGKIYRRGLDYTNTMGGAIYVGQIQGPRGKIAPLTLMNMASFDNISSSSVIEGQWGVIEQPDNTFSIDQNGYGHVIKVGYKNYVDSQDKIKSAVGIDVPIPVVRFNAKIIQPNSTTITHPSIVNGSNADTYTVDFNNIVHQNSYSVAASSVGITYYDYQITVPKSASNISVAKSSDASANGRLILSYNTIQKDQYDSYQVVNKNVSLNDVKVVDGIRAASNSDVYEYHLSGENNWHFLGSPSGQFHVYAHYHTNDSNSTFADSSAVITFLNSKFPYGIRIDKGDNTYDMTQAGWLISADYGTSSGLFGFDYRTADGNTPVSVASLASSSYNTTLKKWFQVQSFESGLSNNPQDIILIGNENDEDSYNPDYGTASPAQRGNLKDRGVWFKSENGEKWWV